MRYNKNRVLLITAIVLLAILLTLLTVSALISLSERNNTTPGGSSSTGTEQVTQPSTNTSGDLVIQTPYGDLVFPGQWAQYLKTEQNDGADYGINFHAKLESGKEQLLFTLEFGEAKAPAVGQVRLENGQAFGVYVFAAGFTPDETWDADEVNIVRAMQEALNDVLNCLKMEPLGTPEPDVEGDELVIDTPYGKLYYPGKWKEETKITIDESDGYEVVFHGAVGGHDFQPLFAVNFGGSKGTVVHTLTLENDIPMQVRLRTFPLSMEEWSAMDQAMMRAMQEDLNHLLAKLREE